MYTVSASCRDARRSLCICCDLDNFLCDNEEPLIFWRANQHSRTRARSGRKGVFLSYQAETPFDSIEGSHEYVALLAEALDEARREVDAEIATAERDKADRRKEALLLVSFNLAKLNLHITTSRRILNDLRTLRRLLLAERGSRPGDERTKGDERANVAAGG
jgi:hypothetical protein